VDSEDKSDSIPKACACAQVGGKLSGISGRVKDFEILGLHDHPSHKDISLIVACGSDGAVRVWSLGAGALENPKSTATAAKQGSKTSSPPPQVGKLLGTYETGNRITCMVAFVMQKPEDPSVMSDSELEVDEENGVEEDSSSDEEED
jgi:protein MAK11